MWLPTFWMPIFNISVLAEAKMIRTVQATSQILAKTVAKLCPEGSKICLKSPKTRLSTNLSKIWQFLAQFQLINFDIQNFRPKSKK